MVVAGASMFGLMVFTCVGRFRRKEWELWLLQLKHSLPQTSLVSWCYLCHCFWLWLTLQLVTLLDLYTCDGFCYFTSNHLFFWTANRTHTHKWYFWKQHNIYRETRQIKTHSWLENIMWIYRKQQKFKQKKVTMKFRLRPKLIWVVKK